MSTKTIDGFNTNEVDTSLIELADGSVSDPSLSFISSPDTGLFTNASGNLLLTVNGVTQMQLSTTGETLSARILETNGSVTFPSYSFSNDPDCGMYRSGANSVSFATEAKQRMEVNSNSIESFLPHLFPSGTVSNPSITFNGDTDTGIYNTTNALLFATGSQNRATLNSTALTTTVPIYAPGGTAGAPGVAFSGDPDTGIAFTANVIILATAGTQRISCGQSQVTCNLPLRVGNGGNASPSFSFENDSNSGFWSGGGDIINVTTGGTTRATFTNNNLTLTTPLSRVYETVANSNSGVVCGDNTTYLVIITGSATGLFTVTLPTAFEGRELYIRNLSTQPADLVASNRLALYVYGGATWRRFYEIVT